MGKALFGLLVSAAIFIPLEKLFALRRGQPTLRDGWRGDAVHFLINKFLVQAGLFVVVAAVVLASRALVWTRLQSLVAAQPRGLQFVEALLIVDFAGYFAHRLAHRVPFLWRFHSVHHSSPSMDWLAAAREHPIDQIFTRTMQFLPLYALGFSKGVFGGTVVLFTLQAIFLHANVRFRFGPLRWLFATPEFHHWHHSNDPAARDKNFAGQFPWIDALFGTAHLPRGQWPSTYGIDEPMPRGWLRQMAHPFRRRRVSSGA